MIKYFLIIFSIVAVFSVTQNTLAADCRSEKGGYCAKMAAIAQTQGLENIISGTDVGDLVPGIYRFGLGLVGISALVALIVGGVMYMTAGGSQDQTKRARVWLGNAVFGLVLALLSYVILNTINPDLVRRLDLRPEPIRQETVGGGPAGRIFCEPLNRYTTENECIRAGFGVQCAGPGGELSCVVGSCPSGYNPTGNQCNLPTGSIPPPPPPPAPGTNCNVVPATQRSCQVTAPCSCAPNETLVCGSQRIWICQR